MNEALDAALIAAHGRHDAPDLIRLYLEAADAARDAAQEGFFLTQAYVFALESHDPRAPDLHKRLRATGREA